MTRFQNGRILGWFPAEGDRREPLRNTEGDFDTHFVNCPTLDDDYIAAGDVLILVTTGVLAN